MHLSSALKKNLWTLWRYANKSPVLKFIKPIIPKGYNSITHGSNAMKKKNEMFYNNKNNLF